MHEEETGDTKRLSICFDGIEYESEWMTDEQWDILYDLFSGLLCSMDKLDKIKETLQKKFPTEFVQP